VFRRAENRDVINVVKIEQQFDDQEIPDEFRVVQRQETYFGPKMRLEEPSESRSEQFVLTAPADDKEGMLWRIDGMDWVRTTEIVVEFSEDLPQYDICPDCGEPIKNSRHETAAFLGTCNA